MPENTGSGSNARWYRINNGTFLKKADLQNHEVKLTSEKGVETYWNKVESLEGFLEDISFKPSDNPTYGEEMTITLRDVDLVMKFTTQLSGRVGNAILKRLPNLDVSRWTKLKPFVGTNEKNGKDYNAISVSQSDNGANSEKIFPFYTKDNPNGLPPMEEVIVKGKDSIWNTFDQDEYLKKYCREVFLPKIKGSTPSPEKMDSSQASDTPPAGKAAEPSQAVGNSGTDDLPF